MLDSEAHQGRCSCGAVSLALVNRSEKKKRHSLMFKLQHECLEHNANSLLTAYIAKLRKRTKRNRNGWHRQPQKLDTLHTRSCRKHVLQILCRCLRQRVVVEKHCQECHKQCDGQIRPL